MADADKPDTARAGKDRADWKPAWLEAYADCGTAKGACEVVGINRSTAYDHRAKDPDFAAAWDALETTTTKLLEETAFQRALNGSDRLAEFMLRARRPKVYRDSLKLEGEVNLAVKEGMTAEIQRLTERLADLARAGTGDAAGKHEVAGMAGGS